MTIGVLAFHGDFAEHLDVLKSLSVQCREVRSLADLDKVHRLIIPGGESTVMSRFLDESGLDKEIIKRVVQGSLPIYGTCAGAILLAKKVTGKNAPRSLKLIDMVIDRNAYGTQAQSFQTELKLKGMKKPLPVAFIRAPMITKVGEDVEVLASHNGFPVLVKQGSVLAGTFHPEVRGQDAIHRLFLCI
ncbi:pyridoxal 5'-phosphate synthase glutaminase subunit PdxT [Candidatus Peribacteria bacterium]|nr:pyridoxal 5'-phosphate synthase glutaminase subunit PdxT [Candidatus Peribacteria bacterium]